MKRFKVFTREDHSYRVLRIRKADATIVFELSGGNKIDVDLMESPAGSLLLRAYKGEATPAPKSGAA